MTEYVTPGRAGLILGAVIVALYGLQQEYLLAARHWKYEDINDQPVYAECKRLIAALKRNEKVATVFDTIMDRMAHTRQILHVSYEEWEATVPISHNQVG